MVFSIFASFKPYDNRKWRKRLRLAFQITRGLFLTDPNRSAMGRVWQVVSRFTWELPQTLVGWLFTVVRALVGRVDRVGVLGGITFALGKARSFGGGVSLGSFIDLWLWRELSGDGDGFVVGNQLCMHEFGHTADSQRFGWAYLPLIGLPSLLSAMGKGNHNVFWTETRANRHAKRYFSKHYAVAWNDSCYPTENLT
ncbi:MAG: hypothetical protein IJQ11_14670 [Bacteroidales bacterium]|nr:hypothetical protein [Bacteroidales bacterium]